jgi:2-methylisocitrate lyase-like PEP mutase family enzyme
VCSSDLGIKGPLSIAAGLPYNIKNMSIADLRSCGVARVSLPMIAVMAAIGALKQTLASIRDSNSFVATLEANSLCSTEDMAKLCAKCGKL